MKRYILILTAFLLLPLYVSAQNIKRGNVMPGFFVPDGALQTQRQPEKLPPVEAIQYGKKMSEALQEAQMQKQQEELAQQQKKQQEEQQEAARKAAVLSTAGHTNVKPKNSFLPTQYTASTGNSAPASSTRKKIKETPETIDEPQIISTADDEDIEQTQVAAIEETQTANTDDDENNIEATVTSQDATHTPTTDDSVTLAEYLGVSSSETQAGPRTTPTAEVDESTPSQRPVTVAQDTLGVIMSDYQRDLNDISNGKTPHNERLEKIIADFTDKEYSI